MNTDGTQPTGKKMGAGAKWGIGCGIGCLVVIVLLVVAALVGTGMVKKLVADKKAELKALGFENEIAGHMLEVRQPIDKPTLLMGQMVRIFADCSTNVAVLAQSCEVHGKVNGRLYFRGQMLVIQPNAEITGGMDLMAQVVQVFGTVRGEVTGTYQSYNDRTRAGAQSATNAAPPDAGGE